MLFTPARQKCPAICSISIQPLVAEAKVAEVKADMVQILDGMADDTALQGPHQIMAGMNAITTGSAAL
ncbi:hypothetical protein ASD80_08240 [Devosia sp. Root635]|nr:hypothetical protein ASD80_08240 [Devosia sp. Root635]